jgi:carboxymethylenebutenolidase
MAKTITLKAKDGHAFSTYLVEPTRRTARGALVVVQEIFGANKHMRHVADGFAAEGFVALVPALFDRVETGVELGYDPKSVEAGRNIRGKIPLEDSLADLQATIRHAESFGNVGVVGYCWGGSLAFLAATRLKGIGAAVGYYGSMIAAHAEERPRVPTMLHFGETDQGIPMTDVEKIRKARPDVPIHVYKAGHGFSCDERGSYDAESAKLALQRTLKFFAETLG